MRGSRVAVCSNCGGNDFVWAENLRTGGLGRGGLSLRSGGELAIGTRVCRGCGHADLFVKDPTVLRQPHTWRPGEFVPIPARTSAPARPATPGPVPWSPGPGPSAGAHPSPSPSPVAPTPSVGPVAPPTPTPSGSPGPAPLASSPAPAPVPAASPATDPLASVGVSAERSAETTPKKPTRRKGPRSKATNAAVIHE